MSLINTNSQQTQLSFSVRTPIPPYNPNRTPPLRSGVAIKDDLGAVSTAIPAPVLLGHTIVVSPTTLGQVYTLPSASSILYEFGRSNDTGVPKTGVGNMLVLNVVNRGTVGALIATNAVGGDGTVLVAYNGGVPVGGGASYTGAALPKGRITPLYLEWLQVSGGVNGATGQYTIYN
jgi:hypothetical protein